MSLDFGAFIVYLIIFGANNKYLKSLFLQKVQGKRPAHLLIPCFNFCHQIIFVFFYSLLYSPSQNIINIDIVMAKEYRLKDRQPSRRMLPSRQRIIQIYHIWGLYTLAFSKSLSLFAEQTLIFQASKFQEKISHRIQQKMEQLQLQVQKKRVENDLSFSSSLLISFQKKQLQRINQIKILLYDYLRCQLPIFYSPRSHLIFLNTLFQLVVNQVTFNFQIPGVDQSRVSRERDRIRKLAMKHSCFFHPNMGKKKLKGVYIKLFASKLLALKEEKAVPEDIQIQAVKRSLSVVTEFIKKKTNIEQIDLDLKIKQIQEVQKFQQLFERQSDSSGIPTIDNSADMLDQSLEQQID